jgi:hypothetical protein
LAIRSINFSSTGTWPQAEKAVQISFFSMPLLVKIHHKTEHVAGSNRIEPQIVGPGNQRIKSPDR